VRVRVVVVNWNGRRWLDGCLRAIARQTAGAEVVIVDNASDDGSAAFVRASFPSVTVVEAGANTGFARGNNLGAAGASTEFLAFLNNDTVPDPDWLEALVGAADRERADLVASRIVFMEPAGVIDSAGDGYLRCGGAFKIWHGRPADTAPPSGEVFGACGAAFLIRRALFEELGGFDERFFMVYEDVDLSYRARLLGARVVYAADATVLHAGSGSLGKLTTAAVYYGQRNLEWTWLKNTPWPLLWRSLLPHVAYGLAGFAAYARGGHAGAWLRAKAAAAGGLPGVLASRRRVQGSRRADSRRLWGQMTANWVGVKRAEKNFDFRGAP
jgi:GT2 family glycosyltransferase